VGLTNHNVVEGYATDCCWNTKTVDLTNYNVMEGTMYTHVCNIHV